MKMKTLTLAAVLGLLSTGAFAQSAFDRYNAGLNTPAAKEALRKSVCSSANNTNLALCDRWNATGVPNSDVRIGVVATSVVLGAAAGAAAATVPVGALGGETVLGHWGVTSIAGWGVTAASAGAAGAVTGAVVGAGVSAVR